MKRLAKLAFAAVALALLIRFVSPEALLAALRQADGRWVTAGIALLYTSQLLGSLNFHQILVARSARLGRMDVVRADLAGQFYALGLPGGSWSELGSGSCIWRAGAIWANCWRGWSRAACWRPSPTP